MANLVFAEQYIALVKARFYDTTPEIFNEFKVILDKCREESETMDKSALFSEVKNLFTTHTDLIEMFKDFLDNLDDNQESSSVELNVVEQESEIRPSLVNSVDFIDKVKRVLNDDEKFLSFFMMTIGFQQHKDVARVRREVFGLFKEHPELEIEFSMFLAEKIAGRRIQDMVDSENRKRKEAKDRIDRAKDRNWSQLELLEFDTEDGMFKRELGYHLILRAKEGAVRLIMDNEDRKPPNEMIRIADYFRGLNVKFMRDELKIPDECRLLSGKPMERGWALLECEKFVPVMDREIAILTKDWDEKQKEYFRTSRKRELEIPVFKWQAVQRTE